MTDFPRRRKNEVDPEALLTRLAVSGLVIGVTLIGWSFADGPAGIAIPGVAMIGVGSVLGLFRVSLAVAEWREHTKAVAAKTAAVAAFPNSPRCEACGFPVIERRHQTPEYPEGIPPWEDAAIHLARAGGR